LVPIDADQPVEDQLEQDWLDGPGQSGASGRLDGQEIVIGR
jgi:hypothetical protein